MNIERLKMTVEIVSLYASSYKLSTQELLEKIKEIYITLAFLEGNAIVSQIVISDTNDDVKDSLKPIDLISAAA